MDIAARALIVEAIFLVAPALVLGSAAADIGPGDDTCRGLLDFDCAWFQHCDVYTDVTVHVPTVGTLRDRSCTNATGGAARLN